MLVPSAQGSWYIVFFNLMVSTLSFGVDVLILKLDSTKGVFMPCALRKVHPGSINCRMQVQGGKQYNHWWKKIDLLHKHTHLINMEHDVQLAHVAKVAVKGLNYAVNELQNGELILLPTCMQIMRHAWSQLMNA